MIAKVKVEFLREYNHAGMWIPKGAKVEMLSGNALTLEHRGVVRLARTPGRPKGATKLDHTAKGATDTASGDSAAD